MAGATPPQSPDADDVPEPHQPSGPERTPQRRRGRKNVAKGRAQAYRDLNEMKEKLAHALRKAEKYKKRSDRLKRKMELIEPPKRRTKKQINQSTTQLKRTLLFHNTIISEIRKKVENRKTRQIISKTMAKKEFGFSLKLMRTNMTRTNKLIYTRKTPKKQSQPRSEGKDYKLYRT